MGFVKEYVGSLKKNPSPQRRLTAIYQINMQVSSCHVVSNFIKLQFPGLPLGYGFLGIYNFIPKFQETQVYKIEMMDSYCIIDLSLFTAWPT